MSGFDFDWHVLLTPETLSTLGSGLAVTLLLAFFSGGLAIMLGLGVTRWSISEQAVKRRLSVAFVEAFRNIPALILVLGLSFAAPMLLPLALRRQLLFDNALIHGVFAATKIQLWYFTVMIIALALNTAAYLAEILRAGFESVDRIQIDAALASGLTRTDVVQFIIVPQGLLVSRPPATTRLIHNLKNTALAIFVPVPDFFSALQTMISKTFQGLEFILAGIVIYLVLGWLTTALLQRKYGYPEFHR